MEILNEARENLSSIQSNIYHQGYTFLNLCKKSHLIPTPRGKRGWVWRTNQRSDANCESARSHTLLGSLPARKTWRHSERFLEWSLESQTVGRENPTVIGKSGSGWRETSRLAWTHTHTQKPALTRRMTEEPPGRWQSIRYLEILFVSLSHSLSILRHSPTPPAPSPGNDATTPADPDKWTSATVMSKALMPSGGDWLSADCDQTNHHITQPVTLQPPSLGWKSPTNWSLNTFFTGCRIFE